MESSWQQQYRQAVDHDNESDDAAPVFAFGLGQQVAYQAVRFPVSDSPVEISLHALRATACAVQQMAGANIRTPAAAATESEAAIDHMCDLQGDDRCLS